MQHDDNPPMKKLALARAEQIAYQEKLLPTLFVWALHKQNH
jgi:hypothetical protein